MTAQTPAQRNASYRRRMAEKMAALKASLVWAIAEIEGRTSYADEQRMENCLQKAKEALQGSETTRKPLDPTQRG